MYANFGTASHSVILLPSSIVDALSNTPSTGRTSTTSRNDLLKTSILRTCARSCMSASLYSYAHRAAVYLGLQPSRKEKRHHIERGSLLCASVTPRSNDRETRAERSILSFVHRRSRSTEPRSLALCLDLGAFRLAPGLATMGLRLKGPEIRTLCYFIGASTGAFRRKGGSRGQAS